MIYQIRYDINGREKKLRFRITPQAVQSGAGGGPPVSRYPGVAPAWPALCRSSVARSCLADRRLHQDRVFPSHARTRTHARGRAYPRGLRRPFRALARLRNREYPTAPTPRKSLFSLFSGPKRGSDASRLASLAGDLSDRREGERERGERLTLPPDGSTVALPCAWTDHRSVGRSLGGCSRIQRSSSRVHRLVPAVPRVAALASPAGLSGRPSL